jgi:NAD(P)-dependent dehydrogenase (short-subunit alcohol dehydrogenase family)
MPQQASRPLQDRVVLVTGGAVRIGKAIAMALAARGASVAFTYRTSGQQAQATLKSLKELGVPALAIRADLSRAADVKRLMARVWKAFGRLDVLINSASNFYEAPYDRLNEHDWDLALDANAKGPFLCSWHASHIMRRTGSGKIINFADWAGERPHIGYLPYCVSKAAVIGLTKALAKELAPLIQVNAIAPGPVLAPEGMTAAQRAKIAAKVPLRRWGSPRDIVNTVLYLIEGTDFMTGSVVHVDGGRLIA